MSLDPLRPLPMTPAEVADLVARVKAHPDSRTTSGAYRQRRPRRRRRKPPRD